MSDAPLGTIRAITFDVGNTLIRAVPSNAHHYAEILKKEGLNKSTEQLKSIMDKTLATFERKMFREDLDNSSSDAKERDWWRTVDQAIARNVGITKNLDSISDRLYERFAQPESWEPYPDAIRVLGALRNSGYTVGALSNWNTGLRSILKHHKLDTVMDFIIISAEVGTKKPGTAIFQKASQAAGVEMKNLLHVGDHPDADFHGARAAGAQAVLIGRKNIEGVYDDLLLGTLREIFFVCWEDRFGRYGITAEEARVRGQQQVLRVWEGK